MNTLIEAGADLGEALLMGLRAQNVDIVKQLISVRAPRESHHGLTRTDSVSTRWTTVVPRPPILGGHVTKFAPCQALKLLLGGKLSFDERFVVHRVIRGC